MRSQTLVIALILGCVSSLAIDTAINQSAVAQTAAQIRRLKAVGIPTVMPSYRPRGFRFTKFKVELGGKNNNHYEAFYKGPNNSCFEISGADGGFGAPGGIRQWVVNTQLFGRVILQEISFEQSSISPYLLSDIMEIKGYPKLVGYIFSSPGNETNCNNPVSPQEASRIIKSMRIVNR